MGCFAGPEINESGLVLALDAGNTKSYPGSGTTWTDLSGNGNNATLVNGPTYSSGNGGFIAFDGVDDYISFSSPLVVNTNSGFTIELMSYISSTQNNAQWSYFYSDGIGSWEIGTYSTTPGSFEFKDTGTSGTPSVLCTLSSPWQHIVFGCNAQQAFMYNNLSYSTNATLFRNANVSISNLNRSQSTSNKYFKTNQCIIRIYNRALSAAEVSQNYNATRGRYGL